MKNITYRSLKALKRSLKLAFLANLLGLALFIIQTLAPIAAIAQTSAESTPKTALLLGEIARAEAFPLPLPTARPDKVALAVLTAYTSSPDETDDSPCISADNSNICALDHDVVAVNGLPFGTKIKMPELYGDRVFVVHDRMNRRYSCVLGGLCRMDVYFRSGGKKAARLFGVQKTTIEVFYPVKELAKR